MGGSTTHFPYPWPILTLTFRCCEGGGDQWMSVEQEKVMLWNTLLLFQAELETHQTCNIYTGVQVFAGVQKSNPYPNPS